MVWFKYYDIYRLRKIALFVGILSVIFLGITCIDSYYIIKHDSAQEIGYSVTYQIYFVNIAVETLKVRTVLVIWYLVIDLLYGIGSLILCIWYVESARANIAYIATSLINLLTTILFSLQNPSQIIGLLVIFKILIHLVCSLSIFINFKENEALFYIIFCCFNKNTTNDEYDAIEMDSSSAISDDIISNP